VKDSIMAIADADYFDWPVLPEAPSSLNASPAATAVTLSWQVHGGNPKHIFIERREDPTTGRGAWRRIADLPATTNSYKDSDWKRGQQFSYRVRASNDDGQSASSNIVRLIAP
jgi:hypothetical protein